MWRNTVDVVGLGANHLPTAPAGAPAAVAAVLGTLCTAYVIRHGAVPVNWTLPRTAIWPMHTEEKTEEEEQTRKTGGGRAGG